MSVNFPLNFNGALTVCLSNTTGTSILCEYNGIEDVSLFYAHNMFPEKVQRMDTIQKKDFQEVGFAAAVLRQEAHALTMMLAGWTQRFATLWIACTG